MQLIGQSLECWRGPLAAAVARRDAAPLLRRARRQLDAGAQALDVNFGATAHPSLMDDLRWAAATLRATFVDVTLFLDCGDLAVLAAVTPAVAAPLVINAVPLDTVMTPAALHLLETAAASGAGVVFSPQAADRSAAATAILAAAEQALLLAHNAHLRGPLYLDCLAYPPASHRERCLRSLAWLRALRDAGDPLLLPFVAAGNVGHGAPADLKESLEEIYVVLSRAAGAAALLVRAEDSILMSLVEVMQQQRAPSSSIERWAVALATLPAGQLLTVPPPDGAARSAWELLTQPAS